MSKKCGGTPRHTVRVTELEDDEDTLIVHEDADQFSCMYCPESFRIWPVITKAEGEEYEKSDKKRRAELRGVWEDRHGGCADGEM